jgi:hypothetical protein
VIQKDLFGNDSPIRIMSLRVQVLDQEKAKWIWENHLKGDISGIGIRIDVIKNGDVFTERDELENELIDLKNGESI